MADLTDGFASAGGNGLIDFLLRHKERPLNKEKAKWFSQRAAVAHRLEQKTKD
jgi:hypothetical protein